MDELLQNPILRSVAAGVFAAIWVDVSAWKNFDDARFNIKTAAWRWFRGAIAGFGASMGFLGAEQML
jgi:hypothetical protein